MRPVFGVRRDKWTSTKQRECRHCHTTFTIENSAQRWCKTCNPSLESLNRLRRFDLSQPEFDAMYAAQGGKCHLCEKSIEVRAGRQGVHVDHNHVTKKVRGLLCGDCNFRLGIVERDLGWSERALQYLKDRG